MARRPVPGTTKTRLLPRFTAEDAARLSECFLLDTLDVVRSVPEVTPVVATSPEDADAYFRKIAPDIDQLPQRGDSLGDRLDFVLTECLRRGFDHVAAIGSDVPTLPAWHVSQGFGLLERNDVDVVLGPSEDGGYHFIGWKRPLPRLVRDVEMSTPHVLADTLAVAESCGLHVALLPVWYDVDAPEDVDRLHADLSTNPSTGRHTRILLETVTGSRRQ